MLTSRMPPFEADENPAPTGNDNESERLWRRQVADAARRAADELAAEDNPQTRRLHADLIDLVARITKADTEPPEAADPRPN